MSWRTTAPQFKTFIRDYNQMNKFPPQLKRAPRYVVENISSAFMLRNWRCVDLEILIMTPQMSLRSTDLAIAHTTRENLALDDGNT